MASILVVEDERDTQAMLGQYLGNEGHNVAYANNGWEALLAIGERQFDLILLDMMLPGLDGGKFLQILRRTSKADKTPVVIVTALDRGVAEERSVNGDVSAIVVKKQDFLRELAAAVHGVVGPAGDDQKTFS